MSAAALKLAVAGVLALLLITVGGVWKVQDWRYGKDLAEQAGLHKDDGRQTRCAPRRKSAWHSSSACRSASKLTSRI
jgi:hypothetical protein